MHVVQVNPPFGADLADPEALLAHYDTLVGWSEALLEAGVLRVTVVQGFSRDAEFRRRGVDYVFREDSVPPSPRRWARPRRLLAAAVSAAPDLVHLNGLAFPRIAAALRTALAPDSALVVQDHSGGPPEPIVGRAAGLRGLAWRTLLGGVDAFLFTAQEQARPWQEAGLVRGDQAVHAVLEGSRRIRPLPRAEARRSTGLAGSPELLWVGRLDANKDPLTVLAGFEQAALPDSRLTLVHASDELRPEVERRLAASPFLAARVGLLGRVPYDRMPALFSAADIFVLGSHKEGSGYSLIEALACGAVPAVTDIPSFRAITGDGAVGVLWPTGDAAALAGALRDIARRDLGKLAASARAHFEAHLSWTAVGRRAVEIYRAVIEGRRGACVR